MFINRSILQTKPHLWAFLNAQTDEDIATKFAELDKTKYILHNEFGLKGYITSRIFTVFEVIASQGLIQHATFILNKYPNHKVCAQNLVEMLHVAILHGQLHMIDFCVNHPEFDDSLISAKTFKLAAQYGPSLFFQQLWDDHDRIGLFVESNPIFVLAGLAIKGGQQATLKLLFEFDPQLVKNIAKELLNARCSLLEYLDSVFNNHYTDVLRYLLTFKHIQEILPAVILYWMNAAIRKQHVGAVALFLNVENVERYLNPRTVQEFYNIVLNAAAEGNTIIFDLLLSKEIFKSCLLTNSSRSVTSQQTKKIDNAWTTAIYNGHIEIAQMIYANVSAKEQQMLATDISILKDLSINTTPTILEFLLTFNEISTEFWGDNFVSYIQSIMSLEILLSYNHVFINSVLSLNYIMIAPLTRSKIAGNQGLLPHISSFVTQQMRSFQAASYGIGNPLPVDIKVAYLDMLSLTRHVLPKELITEFSELLSNCPSTLYDSNGKLDPRIKKHLPWQKRTLRDIYTINNSQLPGYTLSYFACKKRNGLKIQENEQVNCKTLVKI